MSKHTPWKVDFDWRDDGAHQVLDSQDLTVCFMATGRGAEESIEETRLVAAAPELLEAAKELRAATPHDCRTKEEQDAWQKLIAAISKAEGSEDVR